MKWDDLSLHPPNPPKKNEIVPVHESGRDYPEGMPKEEPIKFYKVICPRCKAQAGFPCFVNKRMGVSYTMVCIARVILYESFELSGSGQRGPE